VTVLRVPRHASKTKANIVYINGDPTDNNAALFKQGYVEALKPKIDAR
jgi:D-xylose transport system substrate-binding protein